MKTFRYIKKAETAPNGETITLQIGSADGGVCEIEIPLASIGKIITILRDLGREAAEAKPAPADDRLRLEITDPLRILQCNGAVTGPPDNPQVGLALLLEGDIPLSLILAPKALPKLVEAVQAAVEMIASSSRQTH